MKDPKKVKQGKNNRKCLFCEQKTKNKFCSQNCKTKYYYHTKPHIKENAKINQRTYYQEGRRHIHLCRCIQCGKDFKHVRKNTRFCSLECYYKYQKEKSNSFETNRIKALKRDNYTCQICGLKNKKKSLHVHHKEKARYKKGHSPSSESDNSVENLITVCPKCHHQFHKREIKRFSNKGVCLNCGKEFYYYPKSSRGKYCSRRCFYGRKK